MNVAIFNAHTISITHASYGSYPATGDNNGNNSYYKG